MKPDLINQSSAMPTRKLTVAAFIGPAISEAWGAGMAEIAPAFAGPEFSYLVGMSVAMLIGYRVRDRANA